MGIKVVLREKTGLTAGQVRLAKDAIRMAISYYDLRNCTWKVEVNFVEFIEESETERIVGQHQFLGNKQSKILVQSSDRSFNRIISTLFHEFAHLKQLAKGELWYGPGGIDLWKSEYVLYSPTNLNEYWMRPDEVDARKHQSILMKKFIKKRIKDFFVNFFKLSKTKETSQ